MGKCSNSVWHTMISDTSHNLICCYKKNFYMNSARAFEIFPRFHVALLFQLLIPCCLKMNAIHCQAARLRPQTMANALLKVDSVLSPASQPGANVGVGSGHPLGKVHYSSCWERCQPCFPGSLASSILPASRGPVREGGTGTTSSHRVWGLGRG